jgi:hypothetical protein
MDVDFFESQTGVGFQADNLFCAKKLDKKLLLPSPQMAVFRMNILVRYVKSR